VRKLAHVLAPYDKGQCFTIKMNLNISNDWLSNKNGQLDSESSLEFVQRKMNAFSHFQIQSSKYTRGAACIWQVGRG
jgi:hypothetical protein